MRTRRRRNLSKIPAILAWLVLAASLSGSSVSRAQDFMERSFDVHERLTDRGHRSLALGVCIGQNLNQQGISLPAPVPGQPYLEATDPGLRQALQAAFQTCQNEFRGVSVSPSPTPSPVISEVPSPEPVPVPVLVPTPAPSAASS